MHRFARIGIVGLLLLTTFLSYSLPERASADSGADFEPNQVVVKLNPLVNVSIDAINQAYGTTTLDVLFNHRDIFLLQTPAGASPEVLVQLMSADPNLEWAELNFINENPEGGSSDRIYGWGGYDSSLYRGQESTRALQLDEAHQYSRGSGALIAILDTGVQLDHPELAGSLDILGFDFVGSDPFPQDEANGQDDDGDGWVDEGYGHGTHVTGIAHLVAPDARLMPLRVLDSDGRGNDFRTANAILYAAYHGAGVINLSLGTLQPSKLLAGAVKEAAGMGALVVAAAGNLNSDQNQYPAAQACAIAVTSVDDQWRKSSFANFGAWVDLVVTGEQIYSTFPVDAYAAWSGTSMSTPFAAGQAALLRSAGPQLTLEQLGLLIGGTASSVDHKNPAYRGRLGQGQIDILKSLENQASGARLPSHRNVLADCSP